jgi:Protein of unknown function (DUF3040)
VPLSKHELRVLHDIEQALISDEPKFASSIWFGGSDTRPRIGAPALAIAASLGVVCILFGLVTASGVGAAVAVAGFVLIVASCWGTVHAWRRRRAVRPRGSTE